jgi:hypothetical protein
LLAVHAKSAWLSHSFGAVDKMKTLQYLRWACGLAAFVGASLGVVRHDPERGWSIDVTSEAHAACAYTKGPGQFCADVTEQCAQGCAPTSCRDRLKLLTTQNGPFQLVTFFQGAVNRCSKVGNRTQVFECAWGMAVRSYPGLATDQCTKDGLWKTFDSIAYNYSLRTPIDDPETCPSELPKDGSLPQGYFVLNAPRRFLDGGDGVKPAGSQFNVPPAHNIGTNEGRLSDDKSRRTSRIASSRGRTPISASPVTSPGSEGARPRKVSRQRRQAWTIAARSRRS